MGRFLDGKASAVVGSHTHVQTADEVVSPVARACLTDAGMCGPIDSILASDRSGAAALPHADARPLRRGAGPVVVHGAMIDIDEGTGARRRSARPRAGGRVTADDQLAVLRRGVVATYPEDGLRDALSRRARCA
jgi:calcineurin-like phosphoesterase